MRSEEKGPEQNATAFVTAKGAVPVGVAADGGLDDVLGVGFM